MMWVMSRILLAVIGASAGFMVSGGVFTVLFVVGLTPRLAGKTDTAHFVHAYENSIIAGTAFGALLSIYPDLREMAGKTGALLWVPLQNVILGVLGIFTGIFVGCLALAAAEMFDAMPIMIRRQHAKKGITAIITAIALGKLAGAVYYFWLYM